ncbi:MAG TPA: CheR family methyltransferase [Burkholderiales bacterium]|nr:CheR family methyltransferase [Burkholderiales bacterium]
MTEAADAKFEALLQFLQQQRGFDFTGYKRPSLVRRVERRMQMLAVKGYDDYRDYLEVHPEEFAHLFNTILINVTSFFRDEAAWDYLRKEVVPRMLAAKHSHDSLRIWSAGCASGQEAYSLAIAFAEAMDIEAFRERVKIYATDVDEEALGQARLASYTPKEMESIEGALRDRYFEAGSGRYVFRTDLRRSVIFGRHDLLQDAPISRLDLLVCRNTLMYFNAETQANILQRFHFALNSNGDGGTGFLFLGRAEMLLSHAALFAPVELRCRVFEKLPLPGQRQRAPALAALEPNEHAVIRNGRLRDLALDESPVAKIVIDAQGNLSAANARARLLFSINPKDIGRALQDLEISYRPLELRALIEQAYAERRPITRTSVERRFADADSQLLDITVAPLLDEARNALGVGITFLDVTRHAHLAQELQRSREEVQTTTEELQSSNEELETTNEELQSSNEELETTNEELQSTNEELETMNEELQSTNEELQTVNDQLRQRTEESNQLNAFLESVLTGLRSAAIVVNQDLNVLMWNPRAADLWGLRADEVQGRSLLNLDIGLPAGELRTAIRPCLTGERDHHEVALDAVNRRGKKIRCQVTCTPLLSAAKKREGVILLIDELA